MIVLAIFSVDNFVYIGSRRSQNTAAALCPFYTVPQRKNQNLDIQGLRFSERLFSEHRPSVKNPNTTKDSPSKT